MNKTVVEMSSADIFQVLKKSWMIIFLVPCLLALIAFLTFKSIPTIWEGRAVIKVGKINPSGIGLMDRKVLSQIEEEWTKSFASQSLIKYAKLIITNRDDFYCEVIIGSQNQDIVKGSIESLFKLIEHEQLRLLSIGIREDNEHIDSLTTKINDLQKSLSSYREVQKTLSHNSRDYYILDDLISTKESIYNGLVENRQKIQQAISSNVNLKTYYSENIKVVSSRAQPNGNLIVVIIFVFSSLVIGTLAIFKNLFSREK